MSERPTMRQTIEATGRDDAANLAAALGRFTDHARAESILCGDDRLFRAMVDALPAAIYTTDEHGRLLYFNPAAVSFSGRVPQLGNDQWCVSFKLYHADGSPMCHAECPMAVSLREDRPIRGVEAIAERPDGTRVWFMPYPTPLHDRDGMLIGGINMLVDITERKRAEEERAALLLREREARAEAETLNDVARALSGELDLRTLLQTATDAATRLTGATFGAFFYNVVDEQGGAYSLYTLSGAPREAFEEFGVPRNTALFAPTFHGEGPVRISDVRKDPRYGRSAPHHGMPPGHLPVRSYLAVPVISRTAQVLGGLFFGHPEPAVFTEHGERAAMAIAAQAAIAIDNARLFQETQAEIAQRKKAELKLQEANRRKDEFLAMLAHELRNPLAPIRNGLQILRLATVDKAVIRSTSDMMERQVEHMVRLVEDLLDVSRISRGAIAIRKDHVDLVQVVRNAIDAGQAWCEAKGHALSVELPEHAVYVDGDAVRLAQVVGNLLNNACKYTESGGHIRVAVEESESHVLVRVRDNGVGLTPDQIERIFDMFMQVDTSLERSVGGLGVGLTLAKRLVEIHGGTIEVRSVGIGSGSEFIVRLPTLVKAPEPPLKPPAHDALTVPVGCRVLIVDDSRDSASSLEQLMQLAGCDTRIANDGADCVTTAETFRPDVVLLDIGLPNMSGHDAARWIRAQPWGKDAVLIALTGWGRDEDRRASSDAGFDGHLVKPIDPAELTTLIVSFLAARNRRPPVRADLHRQSDITLG
jgi:PAS domain S-box-containing protein